MRRGQVVALGVALLLIIPLAVFAAVGGGGSKLDTQTFAFRDTPVTTTNTAWTDVPNLVGVVCALGEVSATVSVGITTGPADVRVQVDHAGESAHPGMAHFDPSSGTTSFAFTWVQSVTTQGGTDAHAFAVQWRAPAGTLTTMTKGALTLRYEEGPSGGDCGEPPPTKPNIVLVLTDDQRWDTLWAMPNVQSLLVDQGIEFSNAFVTNPTCCPSRATILTGQYSHSDGIYKNTPPFGGFASFDDSSTVATWLHAGGYRTGLVGKYLNGYSDPVYLPPGWDRWVAFTTDNGNGDYFNYNVSVDGVSTHYGNAGADYSTDVLSAEATSFIQGTPVSQPLFLYFSPKAPHDPATPAPRYANAFTGLPPWRPASYNEADVSDKPPYVKGTPQLTLDQQAGLDAFRIDQYRTLLAVDDAVGSLVDTLQATGRLQNTIIVFASDNGYLWGEHRLTAKDVPYEESIRVPMVIRFDALIDSPRTEDGLVLNMDLAPTFAQIGEVPAPEVDGQSLVPLITSAVPWRSDFGIEHLRGGVPTFCAVRNEGFLYASYLSGKLTTELYDLTLDPMELTNVVRVGAYASVVAAMQVRMSELCNPPPPVIQAPEVGE